MDVFGQLKAVSNGVKILSLQRKDLRFSSLTLRDAIMVLQEIELLRSAATVVAKNVTGTARKHAETAIGWLDVFRQDITLYKEHLSLGLPDNKGQKRAEQYERYKARILMSIDNAVQNAERIPLQRSFWKSARNNIAYAAILAGTAFGFSGLSTRTYAEDPKVNAEIKKDVDISDFTDDLAEKLMGKYKTPKAVLDDKEFAGDAKVSYVTSKDGKNDFGKFLDEGKDDAYLVLLCDLNSNTDLFSRRAIIAGKYSAAKLGIELKIYDIKLDNDNAILERLSKKYGSGISNTSFFLVSRYDVVSGETKEKNDGKLKIVDVIYGGPQSNNVIDDCVKGIVKYWLPFNVLEPNGEFAWRTENRKDAPTWKKIQYSAKIEK